MSRRSTIGDDVAARWRATTAAALAGAPALWVESPPLDDEGLVARYLIVTGWLHSPGELDSVEFTVAGRRRPAGLGERREDAERALDLPGGEARAFASYVDLGDVEPGRHELVVTATAGGAVAQQRGWVTVDPAALYPTWLGRRRGAAEPPGARPDAERLEVVGVHENLAASLAAAARGESPGVIAIDPGTAVLPAARERLAEALTAQVPADAAYGDGESEGPDNGARPIIRQGWSPERLLAGDIVGPVLALGPHAAAAVLEGGEQREEIGSVYELALGLADAQLRVERLPEPLSRGLGSADLAGQEAAVHRIARRRGRAVDLRRLPCGLRDLRWRLDRLPPVSIVIPSRYADGLLDGCLRSIGERTDYGPLDVLVVDSTGENATHAALGHLGDTPGRTVAFDEKPFNFSQAVNLGAELSEGELLLILNDDTEALEAQWLRRMVELTQLPDVGVVGAKLLYADGAVQHGGVGLGPHAATVWHTSLGAPGDSCGFDGELAVTRDCAAVTGACMLIPRDLYEQLGGFDASFPMNLGDVDICLRARERGRRVLFSPHASLVHHESATRGPTEEVDALVRLSRRWTRRYPGGDPVEHPVLAVDAPLRVAEADGWRTDRLPAPVATTQTDSERALPLLACDDLPEEDATVFVGNRLRLRGWATGATGPAAVSIEIDGEPVPVVSGTETRRAVETRPETEGAERTDFAVEVDTSAWGRGRRALRIVARDGVSQSSRSGTLDVIPHEPPPAQLGDMVAALEAGGVVLTCEEPALDGTYEAGDRLAVRGWAYARAGVEAVHVSLDGRWRREAELGRHRPDLVQALDPDAGEAGFELLVDIDDLPEGQHWLTVLATGRDGQACGVEGPIQMRRGSTRAEASRFRASLLDAERVARYRWAARIARDTEVLDAACGVGYGAAMLAGAGARRVVGLDRNPDAVLKARERAGEVAEFMLGDLRRLPFDDASLDLVTCFEAIEHVVDTEAVLDELHRVLRPDGVLLISSPSPGSTPGNPDHAHEFFPNELRSALEGRFANVRLHRQQAHLASFVSGDDPFAVQDVEGAHEAEFAKRSTKTSELYTLGAASDASLPELSDVVMLGGVFEPREFLEAARQWEERAIAAEADAAASRAERVIALLARDQESERARRELQAQLDGVRASKSWLLTAPLRWATVAARRRAR